MVDRLSDNPAKAPMKIACHLFLLACACSVGAQPADPLKSDACAQALSALQSARNASAVPREVERLRSAAAGTCLGNAPPPPRPSRIAQPAVSVPPPRIEAPQATPPAPAPALPPPVAIQRPAMPVQCDANGCWTDDGTHLRQVPPTPAGPGGACTQLGGVVYCP